MTTLIDSAPEGVPGLLDNLDLTIRYVAPGTLAAVGRRARSHTKKQIKQIAESIKTFGFTVPILVDEAEKVIAGNARVEAAIQLGIEKVPVVALSHLSPEQKRAFVIAENKLGTLSGWDKDILRLEFEELGALDLDFSLEVTGFLEPEIEAIVFDRPDCDPGDVIPQIEEVPTSRLGDLWLLGEHRLLCADSTKAENLDVLLDGRNARAVFTDAPYNVRIAGHVTGAGKHGEFAMASGEMTDEQFTSFLASSLIQIERALVPGGVSYFCMDWRHAGHVLEAVKETTLQYMNLVVWDKTTGGMGSWYRSRHELIFVLVKPGDKHLNRVELGKHGRDRHNVWCYPGVNGFGSQKAKAREMHPTVKPLALVHDAILDSTAKRDLVLDLFSGSGTTIIAAHASGRVGAALELDPRYVDVGIRRWQEFAGKEARLAATGQTFREVMMERKQNTAAAASSPSADLLA